MAGRRRKQGRPRAIRRIRIEAIRRPESEIDQHALALALIAFHRQLVRRREALTQQQAAAHAEQAAPDNTDAINQAKT
jgi:hypothetical protein